MDKSPERDAAPGPKDTTAYSSTQAPETRAEAEEKTPYSDMRLIPGGRRGSPKEIGMSAMERSDVPSGARELGQVRYGDSPKARNRS